MCFTSAHVSNTTYHISRHPQSAESGRAEDRGDFEVDFTHKRRTQWPHHAGATVPPAATPPDTLPGPPKPWVPQQTPPADQLPPPPQSAPAARATAPPAQSNTERGSPTYEPYQKEPQYEPGTTDRAAAHGSAHQHAEAAAAPDEWAWGRGDGADARSEAHAAWVARKARERALDDKVAALEAQEQRERQQRAARRKVCCCRGWHACLRCGCGSKLALM